MLLLLSSTSLGAAAARSRTDVRHHRLAAPAPRRAIAVMADGESSMKWAEAIALPTNEDSEALLRIRHSSSHVMAQAVQKLFKGTKCTIGPWIEKGFYYDFDPPEGRPFKDTDLRKIKKEMGKIISYGLPFVEEVVSYEEARRRIEAQDEPFKLEILETIVAPGHRCRRLIRRFRVVSRKGPPVRRATRPLQSPSGTPASRATSAAGGTCALARMSARRQTCQQRR